MNKEKVKAYWEKHKAEIILGGVCVLVGYKIGKGKCRYSKDEKKLIDNIRDMGLNGEGESLSKGMLDMLKNCKTVAPVVPVDKKGLRTIESMAEAISKQSDSYKKQNLIGAMLFIE